MKLNRKIKRLIRNTAWCLLGIVLMVVLVASMKANNKMLCKKVIVEIKSGREHLFLNTNDIRNYVNAVEIENKKQVAEIDIKNIEMRLEKNAWIDNVEIYFDGQNNLNIEVYERQPLCRVYKANGGSFYLDEKMNILPLHNFFAANVPVFTGLIGDELTKKDSITLQCITKLAKFVKGNSFWMSQIQQIVVDEHQEFEAIPTIGRHNIIIGDTSNLESKFDKLLVFYNKVLSKVGFEKYRTINIQFKNQIVVSDSAAKSIDTAVASTSIMNLIDNSNNTAPDTTQVITDTVRNTRRTAAVPQIMPPNRAGQQSNRTVPAVGTQQPARAVPRSNTRPTANPTPAPRVSVPARSSNRNNRTTNPINNTPRTATPNSRRGERRPSIN
jgi:cell division protein FtsQ